ncbi:MAG: hypothetical protein ACM3MK_00845 [Chitinophagales bacterium]
MNTTILDSLEWKELANREEYEGPESLLDDILEKRAWTNEEILWVIKRMIFHYALHDRVLKKAPTDKLFDNFVNLMRAVYMIIDQANPDLDDNIRTYICTKLHDATWGISPGTRYYLEKKSDEI